MKKKPNKNDLVKRMKISMRKMIRGSRSITYEKCWWKGCSCRQGKLHGPHLSIVWKAKNGKTTGMYIRKGYVERALNGLKAWKDFMEAAKALADFNREEFFKEMSSNKRR